MYLMKLMTAANLKNYHYVLVDKTTNFNTITN